MILTFLGAGSTVFVRNILSDLFLTPSLRDAEIHLYDIDERRLQASVEIITMLNTRINEGAACIRAYAGEQQRRDALRGSDFVINAIQVGGYEPATLIDFELPAKYGLRQTIGDTLGIGGIFRGIRTLQVMFAIVREMEEECPEALLLNYVNPLAIVTGGILEYSDIRTVGLCHSVQVCVPRLLEYTGMDPDPAEVRWRIAGINHMAWLLEISHAGRDLYPEIKRRAADQPDQAVAFHVGFLVDGRQHLAAGEKEEGAEDIDHPVEGLDDCRAGQDQQLGALAPEHGAHVVHRGDHGGGEAGRLERSVERHRRLEVGRAVVEPLQDVDGLADQPES